MKKWYPIPPYGDEKWQIFNQDGELVATCESRELCEKIEVCKNVYGAKICAAKFEKQKLGEIEIIDVHTGLLLATFEDIEDAKAVFAEGGTNV
jgi:exoribonuclease II